jgi:hypothetical protein
MKLKLQKKKKKEKGKKEDKKGSACFEFCNH